MLSNAPWAPTGYGTQTKQLTSRLVADGHEVAVIANWGLAGAPQVHGGVTIFPGGINPYSLDSADWDADFWLREHDGIVLTLYDTWPLLELPTLFEKHRAFYWAPIDHAPPPPRVMEWAKRHDLIAMAKFGQEQLALMGVRVPYIPHGIETSVFKPTVSEIRSIINVPEDAHLAMFNGANIGQAPPRKRFFENLMAWRIFAERHPDAYLYVHSQLQHPRGIDLAAALVIWGIPRDRLRMVNQDAYRNGMVTQEDLAALYTAADVFLMATAGEGFGIPAIEAQACGTPVIVTDFSAQPELVGAGWKVPYISDWDYGQMSGHALPDIPSIVAALEQSYEASKDPAASAALAGKALAKAAEYDADLVYAESWRPFLAAQEVKPNRQQRRAQKRVAA